MVMVDMDRIIIFMPITKLVYAKLEFGYGCGLKPAS